MPQKKRDAHVSPRVFPVLFAIIAIYAALCSPAHAVPAWARKTGLTCASCHIGGTSRLTELGRDFQMRGHRLKSDADSRPNMANVLGYFTLAAKLRHQDKEGVTTSDNLQTSALMAGGPLTRNLGFYAEYTLYDRLPYRTESTSGFLDAYLQYASDTTADSFWFARAGRMHPYAVYALGTGGRIPLSRARVVADSLGGLVPSIQRRTTGVSAGFSGADGWRVETGSQFGITSGGSAARPDVFLAVEKNVDEYGSGVGVYGRSGWRGTDEVNASFTQTGVMGRFLRERYAFTGAYLMARTRDNAGAVARPDGFFVEAATNLQPELTGFLRFDDVAGTGVGAARSRGLVLGISQRIPNSGRAVLEFSNPLTGTGQSRSLLLDLVLMY
jgi:hypothetical protein